MVKVGSPKTMLRNITDLNPNLPTSSLLQPFNLVMYAFYIYISFRLAVLLKTILNNRLPIQLSLFWLVVVCRLNANLTLSTLFYIFRLSTDDQNSNHLEL